MSWFENKYDLEILDLLTLKMSFCNSTADDHFKEEESELEKSCLSEKKEETGSLQMLEEKNPITSIISSFDDERKVEKRLLQHFCDAITSRSHLMKNNISMLSNIIEYVEYKCNSVWRHRLRIPVEELNLFKVTTQAMARHLYILENFRQTEINRLQSKIVMEFKQGLESRNATHRAHLKSVTKEALRCQCREKRVSKRYDAVMGRLAGDNIRNIRDAWEQLTQSRASDKWTLSVQTWRESTQRAKLQEAKNLRKEAEDAVLTK